MVGARDGVADLLNQPTSFFPVIRAQIRSINGEEIEPRSRNDGADQQQQEDDENGPPLDLTFSLTYQEALLPNEELLDGVALFAADDLGVAQVSVSEIMLGSYPFTLGDRMVFNIQGVPLEAEVVSIRTAPDENGRFAPQEPRPTGPP